MGALVVLAGVAYSVYCVRKIDGKLDQEIYAILLKYSQEIAVGVVTINQNMSRHSTPKSAASTNEISNAVKKLTKEADLRKTPFYIAEFSLALIGTLIWAFGDWFVCSAHTWSLNTCSP